MEVEEGDAGHNRKRLIIEEEEEEEAAYDGSGRAQRLSQKKQRLATSPMASVEPTTLSRPKRRISPSVRAVLLLVCSACRLCVLVADNTRHVISHTTKRSQDPLRRKQPPSETSQRHSGKGV